MDFVDPALHYIPRPGWRARIDAHPDAKLRARRVAVLMLVLLAHLWLFERLRQQHWQPDPTAGRSESPLAVVWLSPTTRPEPPSPRKRATQPTATLIVPPSARTATRSAPPDPPARASTSDEKRPRLFGADGQLLLPEAVSRDLDGARDPRARFDYKVPGLIEARTQTPRPQALTYEATRFDKAWIEEKDPLTAALEKAVEKTTVKVRIPLPRAPGSKVVCHFALLAAAGGCGIRNESDGYVVRLDDPDTLDANEDARCQGWWDTMASTSSETAWHAARKNFEAHCRKPPAPSASGSH